MRKKFITGKELVYVVESRVMVGEIISLNFGGRCDSQSDSIIMLWLSIWLNHSLLGAVRHCLVKSSVLPWLRGGKQKRENESCEKLHFLSFEMFPMHWSGMVWQAVGRERLHIFTHHQLFIYVIRKTSIISII